MSTLPQVGDTARVLWARILTKFSQMIPLTGNVPLYTDSKRQLIVKVLRILTAKLNLIPAGAVYDANFEYVVTEIIGGATYIATFGVNEQNFNNQGGNPSVVIPAPSAGQSVTFIATFAGTFLFTTNGNPGDLVTATIYKV
jgi:hypothetical protein